MAYLDNFHLIVGETIMECQRIEHDIKLIYAGMLKGDLNENLKIVKDKALGQVLVELKKLDNSVGNPCLKQSDYNLLKEIKDVRNWLVHKAYMDFIYDKATKWELNLNNSYNKLINFNKKMKTLGDQMENVRLDILKHFGRI